MASFFPIFFPPALFSPALFFRAFFSLFFLCCTMFFFAPVILGPAHLFAGHGTDPGRDIHLESINFAFDSDKAIEDLKQLERIKAFMEKDESLILEISAHTDTTGTERYNLDLSQRRGEAVKGALTGMGIDPGRIFIKANAFTLPMAPDKDLEGKLLNRRVDFSIFRLRDGLRDYYYRDNTFIKPLETEYTGDRRIGKKDDPGGKEGDWTGSGQDRAVRDDLVRVEGPSMDDVMDRLDRLETLLKDGDGTTRAHAEGPLDSSGGSTGFQLFSNNIFSLSGGVGANNGEFLGNLDGRLFLPLSDHIFALQGGFRADMTEEFNEYQMDAGLVGRHGWYQFGLFASMKLVNMDMYSSTGNLSQVHAGAARLFDKGTLGIFFTRAIQDEDVVESRSDFRDFENRRDLYTTETYLKVSDKIGINMEYGFDNGLLLQGDVGSQNADDADIFGSLRLSYPLHAMGGDGAWRVVCQADYNNGYLEKKDNYSAFLGMEFTGGASGPYGNGSGTSGKFARVSHEPDSPPAMRPMAVQRISYDVKSRTSVLHSGVNDAPTVSIRTSTIQGASPLAVTFTAVAWDSDGVILSYQWDFGDGNQGNGEEVTHTYEGSGLYRATLTVTDNKGARSSASTNVDILNAPPQVSITSTPLQGGFPHKVTFTGSFSDSDGYVTSHEWDFGDGTTATGESVTHTFKQPGTYHVQLKVIDNLMAVSTATVTVTATSHPPGAALKFTVFDAALRKYSFHCEAWDTDGTIRTVLWNMGDGTYSNLWALDHTYDKPGNYRVTLTVTDSQGLTARDSAIITVP
ncbi:MAG: PKD domain-containing protein [Desulfamplus sp.]|nr:PKD domain-containing protein [Desulfamplus sp.]